MDEKKVVSEEQEQLDFEAVTETYSSSSQSRRRSAGAVISRTGYGETNTNGTVEFQKLTTALGHRLEELTSAKFGVNVGAQLIAIYMAQDGEPGATTVKCSKDKRTIYFHLGPIFDKYPTLRPSGEVVCAVKLREDRKGKPCITVNLKGTSVRKGRNSSESGSGEAAQKKQA